MWLAAAQGLEATFTTGLDVGEAVATSDRIGEMNDEVVLDDERRSPGTAAITARQRPASRCVAVWRR